MRYLELADFYKKLDSTTKRLEKTYYISKLLSSTPKEDLPLITLLIQGRLFPSWEETETGVASQLVIKALSLATGMSADAIAKEWKAKGDLGLVAEKITAKKIQATLSRQSLTVAKVFSNLRKLATMTGSGSVDRKIQLIAELLSSAEGEEARYIIRTVLGDLRVGVGSGSLRDAIVWAYFPKVIPLFTQCPSCKSTVPKIKHCTECKSSLENSEAPKGKILNISSLDDLKHLEKYDFISAGNDKLAREAYNFLVSSVQSAFDMSNDFGEVALQASKGLDALSEIALTVGKPVKVMLAIKAETLRDGFEQAGIPCQLEYKLDGFRMQIHKERDAVKIFTRRLDNVTAQFPDVVDAVKKHVRADSFILDSEAVGFNPGTRKYMPFQHISQRIKRKYDIEKLALSLPVELNVFDILYYNGKNMIREPFKKRRELIERIVRPEERKLVLAKSLVTSDEKEARAFFIESKARGNEGIMFKNLDAPYKPGARVGFMIKYKETLEPLDLTIVAAEWGHGKRAHWLSSFTVACKNEDGFAEIGKVGTGIKEKEEEGLSFKELTKLIKPLIISESGTEVKVKPRIVVEVAYEEIQKSPTYGSGYALRFPRVTRLRDDRMADDCDTLERISQLFESQRFK